MTKFIIVRSGLTDWNTTNRIQGAVDVPLNEDGKLCAGKLAETLSDQTIDALYSSDLSRSYETAQIIGVRHKLKPKRLKELNELDQGLWQGLCEEDIKKRYKKQYGLWRSSPFSTKPPQGEDMKDAYDRIISAVHKIADKYRNGTICIVCHELVISIIKCHFTGQDASEMWNMRPKTGSWEILEIGEEK